MARVVESFDHFGETGIPANKTNIEIFVSHFREESARSNRKILTNLIMPGSGYQLQTQIKNKSKEGFHLAFSIVFKSSVQFYCIQLVKEFSVGITGDYFENFKRNFSDLRTCIIKIQKNVHILGVNCKVCKINRALVENDLHHCENCLVQDVLGELVSLRNAEVK